MRTCSTQCDSIHLLGDHKTWQCDAQTLTKHSKTKRKWNKIFSICCVQVICCRLYVRILRFVSVSFFAKQKKSSQAHQSHGFSDRRLWAWRWKRNESPNLGDPFNHMTMTIFSSWGSKNLRPTHLFRLSLWVVLFLRARSLPKWFQWPASARTSLPHRPRPGKTRRRFWTWADPPKPKRLQRTCGPYPCNLRN